MPFLQYTSGIYNISIYKTLIDMDYSTFSPAVSTRNNSLLRFLGIIVVCLLSMNGAWGQMIISNSSKVTDNLTTSTGVSAPTNWLFTGTGTTGNTWQGTNQSRGTGGGWYGNSNLSYLGSINASNGNATWLLKNNTGYMITGFTISFIARMWKDGAKSPTVSVSWSNNSSSSNPNPGALTNSLLNLTFNDATPNIAAGTTLTQTLSSLSIANGQYIFIRFIHAGGSSSDNLGWDDISFTPTLATPTITVPSPISLNGFSTTIGTSSNSKTFTIGGSYLIDSLVVKAPTGFEVRENKTVLFSSSVSFPHLLGTVSKTIEVRITSTALVGRLLENIVCSSTNAPPQNVEVDGTVNPLPTSQTITFGSLTARTYGDGTFIVSAISGPSYNPVIFTSSDTNIATCSGTNGSTITLINQGTCMIKANQTGNSNYYAASQVEQLLTINKKALTISNPIAASKSYDENASAIISGTLSGIIGSDSVTLNGTGTFAAVNVANGIIVISTSTLGGTKADNYFLTQPTGLTANITKANQTITFNSLPLKNISSLNFSPAATSRSSTIITYISSNSSVATILNGNIHIIGIGFTIITASQAGNTNYYAAINKTQTLTVTAPPIVLAGWDVSGLSEYGTSPLTASSTNPNITIGGLTRGSGVGTGGTAAWDAWGGTTWNSANLLNAINANQFVTFTLSPKVGYTLFLASISAYKIRKSDTGPITGQWQYQIGSGSFTDIGSAITWGTNNAAIDLTEISALQSLPQGTTVTFRIVNYNASSSSGTWYINDLTIDAGNDFAINGLAVSIYNIVASSNDIAKGIVSTAGGTYVAGTLVSLTATPNEGYRFVNWSESGTENFISVANPYNFTASINKNLVANFANFTTTITDNSNASNFADCPSCDIAITSTGTFNIDADKTYNNIIVAPRGKLTLNVTKTLTATTLNLNSDLTGTATYIDNGITTVTTATVQQYLTEGRNWYVSSPVKAANAGSLSTASSVMWWNETIGNWAAAPSDSTLHPLRGYISVSTKATQAITFTGTLNNGPKTLALTRTATMTKEGFNLVGNPYPSYVKWELATRTNLEPTIWYRSRNAGNTAYIFDTYNATNHEGTGLNGTILTDTIPPMQAFWVRVKPTFASGTLAFDNSMRCHKGVLPNRMKAPATSHTEQKVLRLQVSNGINSDEAIVLFNPNASDSFDTYDSPKMSNGNALVPEIYTLAAGEELVINGMKCLALNTEMPLGFRPGRVNRLILKATEIRNFESDIRLILKDNKENKETDITDAPYHFNSDSITTASRFSLILRSAGVTTDLDNTDMKRIVISRNANHQITIQGSTLSSQGSVTLYNAMGQRVAAKHLSGILTIMDAPLPAGVYMVRVTNAGQTTTRKVILD